MLGMLAACGGSAVKPPPERVGTRTDIAVPDAIAHIPLTKPDGSTTTLAAYRGKTVLIADYLTLCTDICPLISANVVAVARALAADGASDKVALLEITVDPHRDKPARMTAYGKLFGDPPPNWTQLRASPKDTAMLWKFFGVEYSRESEDKPASIDWFTHRPQKYDVAHSDVVLFLDAEGHERFVINADPDVQGKNPPVPLVNTLTRQGARALTHPDPIDTWTVGQALSVFSWLLNTHFEVPTG
jgi:protein SCO1/2